MLVRERAKRLKRRKIQGISLVLDRWRNQRGGVLRPSYFIYFHRGQGERPKKVKLAEHDKLLKNFRHKEASVSVLVRILRMLWQ